MHRGEEALKPLEEARKALEEALKEMKWNYLECGMHSTHTTKITR